MQRGSDAGLGPWGILGQEYGPIEKINVLRGLMDLHSVMYPQLQQLNPVSYTHLDVYKRQV